MGGKSKRGVFGSRKTYQKASHQLDDAIRRGDHKRAAVIGVKLAGALVGLDPLVSGIEALAKGYLVGKEHGPQEGLKAVVAELGTSIAAGAFAEGFTAGVLKGDNSYLSEDQKNVTKAAISVALEEAWGPIVDISQGWK